MSLQHRIISIGALGRNRLWNEPEPKRLAHATTTLIRDQTHIILVDPGLPAEVLVQRLDERAGLVPDQVDVVFLTTFRPAHRRGLALLDRATWLMHEPEISAMRCHLDDLADRIGVENEATMRNLVQQERALLARIEPADDKLTRQVHLFPTPGLTPGSAGLLLTLPTRTVIVAGDAVLTQEHFESGRVFEQAADLDAARRSLLEIMEIADEIVPGHDNLFAVAGH